MKLTIYQIDSFANNIFEGNPAAVCPLKEWLADDILLKIAAENNLAETAFYVPNEKGFEIRWFTPNTEVDLCGHATLAAAYVVRNCEHYQQEIIHFYSPRSGELPVKIREDEFILNFPMDQFTETPLTDELLSAIDKKPYVAYKGKTDFMLVFDRQEDIERLQPNLTLIAKFNARGVLVTARGETYDFVSRFFAPATGVNEDAVTGSTHTMLTPYWANELGKTSLLACQLSKRSGEIHCQLLNDRVELSGKAVLYMKGEIFI